MTEVGGVIKESREVDIENATDSDTHEIDFLDALLSQADLQLPSDINEIIRTEGRKKAVLTIKDQLRGLAITLKSLYDSICKNPRISELELQNIIINAAKKYRFTKDQYGTIAYGVDDFLSKRRVIEKYRALYPDDVDLYIAVFGETPSGKIQVIRGPLTLHFICADKQDFAIARYSANAGARLNDDDVEKASLAAGWALIRSRIPELYGTLTIELAPKKGWVENTQNEKQLKTHPQRLQAFYHDQRSATEVIMGADRVFTISYSKLDSQNHYFRILVWDGPEKSGRILLDCDITPGQNSGQIGKFPQTFHVKNGLAVLRGDRLILDLRQIDERYGYFYFYPTYVEVYGQELETSCFVTPLQIYKETGEIESNPSVFRHEEQHQFNNLFSPPEQVQSMDYIVEKSVQIFRKSASKSAIFILTELARNARKRTLDTWARDEVLAQLRDGETRLNIYFTMTENELYDYRKNIADWDSLPKKILDEARSALKADSNFSSVEGQQILDALFSDDMLDLVRKLIDHVFVSEYRANLGEWIQSIRIFDEKGYSRDEVIAILYTSPATKWRNLARHFPSKVTSKPD